MADLWLTSDQMQARIEALTAAVQILFQTHPDPEKLKLFWDQHVMGALDEAEKRQPRNSGSDSEKRTYETLIQRYKDAKELSRWIKKPD
ncbi:hypothetical protein ACODYM_29440 [Burkholderia gladioli]|uniref:hypothetical protein n=1 Tax=Burkholderia gladioli TaxID=28095 RepID=UPI003B515356